MAGGHTRGCVESPTGHLAPLQANLRTTRPLLPEPGVPPILRPRALPAFASTARRRPRSTRGRMNGVARHVIDGRPALDRAGVAAHTGAAYSTVNHWHRHRARFGFPRRLPARRPGVVLARRHRGIPRRTPGREARRADEGRPTRRLRRPHRLGHGSESPRLRLVPQPARHPARPSRPRRGVTGRATAPTVVPAHRVGRGRRPDGPAVHRPHPRHHRCPQATRVCRRLPGFPPPSCSWPRRTAPG